MRLTRPDMRRFGYDYTIRVNDDSANTRVGVWLLRTGERDGASHVVQNSGIHRSGTGSYRPDNGSI
jgi:hypothetical protein